MLGAQESHLGRCQENLGSGRFAERGRSPLLQPSGRFHVALYSAARSVIGMRSVIRLGNRIAAASRGRMLVIALLASGGCNSQQTGPLSVRLDLRNFGYQFAAGAPVAD